MFDAGVEMRWKWNTHITQLFKVYKTDQLWSYYWSQIFWINNISVALVILLTEQLDTLIDKYKEACHDRNCFAFRNSKNSWTEQFHQFQPGSVHAAYLQRIAGFCFCGHWLQLEIK